MLGLYPQSTSSESDSSAAETRLVHNQDAAAKTHGSQLLFDILYVINFWNYKEFWIINEKK